MAHTVYSYRYTVKSTDIDILNHVNNVVYLQWVQEAAIKHWSQLTANNKFDSFVWVVGRHEIDYIRPSFVGDELEIFTWVGKTEGSTSIRHVEIYKDKKVITKSLTVWRLLHAQTFKLVEIPLDMLKILEQ